MLGRSNDAGQMLFAWLRMLVKGRPLWQHIARGCLPIPSTLMARLFYFQVGAGLLAAAEAAGVTVRTGTLVHRIETSDSAVQGVLLADGTSIPADVVVANADLP
jgi:glycine/D-amino acid oxidase-like deaminating enzyme